MKRLLLRFLGLLLLLAAPAARASEPPAPADSWTLNYYRDPQPDRFVEAVRDLSQRGALSKKGSSPPAIAFLSRVLAQNPQRIVPWMNALDDLPEADKKTLFLAVWFSARPEGAAYLESKGTQEFRGKTAPDILAMEAKSPETLDMLWGYFLATGKEEPIRRIVSAFNLAPYAGSIAKFKASKQTDADKNAVLYDATLQAAAWSLRSNCQQHPRVREICETLVQSSLVNGEERRGLLAILQQNRAQPAPSESTRSKESQPTADRPNSKTRDGFGAQLFLTEDTAFFENWKKAENPRLAAATQARRNIPLHTVLLFSAPGLAEGAVDVTADYTVLKPDGSLHAKLPSTACWKGAYSAPPANLQLAQGHIAIRIEPKDPAGHYTVHLLVRDRVKHVELSLETGFDVEPDTVSSKVLPTPLNPEGK